MICRADSKQVAFLETTNILPQSPFWARFKYSQGFIPRGFQLTISSDLLWPDGGRGKKLNTDLLILIRYVSPDACFAYVPYGPQLEPDFENQGVFLEELSEVLRTKLPNDCIFIRYDLMWENQWAQEDDFFDQDDNWLGPPSAKTQEFRVNFNTSNWNLRKSPEDILPKNTFFLDLKSGEDELLRNMRYNTRYNIRRAIKKGVDVREYGSDMLDIWYRLYEETGHRQNIQVEDKDYFRTVMESQNPARDGVAVRLLMAKADNVFLAAMLLVFSAGRATYLYGASSSNRRHFMASYALQWKAILLAKEYGCSEYDMFGCAPNIASSHPLHGVHLYKKGFGGSIFHRMGCWDYPYDLAQYQLIMADSMKN